MPSSLAAPKHPSRNRRPDTAVAINWDTGQRHAPRRGRVIKVEPNLGFRPADTIGGYSPMHQEPAGVSLLTLIFACGLSIVISVAAVLLVGRATLVGAPVAPNSVSSPASPAAPAVAEAAPTRLPQLTSGSDIEQALQPLKAALQQPSVTIQRINALIAFNTILKVFSSQQGSYPDSEGRIVAAQDALKLLNDSEFEKNVAADIVKDMRYVSDGRSFKVLMLGTGDCAVARILRPAMVDPKRAAGDLDCIAYGIWSPLGKDY